MQAAARPKTTVEQRVAAQTVGAVDRYAGDFAYREQARDHHVFALLIHGQRGR